MEKADYLAVLRREASTLAQIARQYTTVQVPRIPSCPAWNMTTLVLHVGRGQYFTAKRLRDRETPPAKPGQEDLSYLKLPAEWLEWSKNNSAPDDKPIPVELVGWFEEGAAQLQAALSELDPETPVWNWMGSSQTKVETYLRQMPIETSIHRWDAQNASSDQKPEPLDAELARNGIDLLFSFLPLRRKYIKEPPGQGETYHFHRTDGEGEWLLRFEGADVTVTQEHAKGDVALRGTASNLLLFLWGRIGADQLEVFGNADLVKRYFELIPPM
jgi:uncharacterized protein (TIGR03083 family)